MTAQIGSLTDECHENFATHGGSIQGVSDKLENYIEENEKVKKEVGRVSRVVDRTVERVRAHDTKLSNLENRMEFAERESRRLHMVIDGLKEDLPTTLLEVVSQLLKDLQVDLDIHACERVYRRGRRL